MNRKGFTLVELLAVIVILSSVSLVAVASISTTLNRRDKKEFNEQKQLARNAAKIYFSLNSNKTCVKISTLKDGDYFNDINKTSKLGKDYIIQYCPTPCCELKSATECKNASEKYYYAYHTISATAFTQATGIECE